MCLEVWEDFFLARLVVIIVDFDTIGPEQCGHGLTSRPWETAD